MKNPSVMARIISFIGLGITLAYEIKKVVMLEHTKNLEEEKNSKMQ